MNIKHKITIGILGMILGVVTLPLFAQAQVSTNFWKIVSNLLQPVVSTWDIYAPANLRFDGEIKPDGSTCANGEILKRTGANDWDCAADNAGGDNFYHLGTGESATSTAIVFTSGIVVSGTASSTFASTTHDSLLVNKSATSTDLYSNSLLVATATIQRLFNASGTIPTFLASAATTTDLFVGRIASTSEIRADFGHVASRFGIGTSTSQVPLTVNRGSSQAVIRIEDPDPVVSSSEVIGTIQFYSNDSSASANGIRSKIESVASSGNGGNSLTFFTTPDSSGTLSEVFRVNQQQRVSVSDTGPDAIFEVSGSGGSDDLLMVSQGDNTDGDRFIIRQNGTAGFGTTTPRRLLHLTNNGTTSQMVLEDASASAAADKHMWSLGSSGGRFSINSMLDNLATTTRFIIDASYNFGFATATPATSFDFFSTGTSTGRMDSNSATQGGCWIFKDTDGTGYTQLVASNGVITAKVSANGTTCN